MNIRTDRPDYSDFQAIVANARMQRSVAAADAIVNLLAAAQSGLSRVINAVKSGACESSSRAARQADSGLDAAAHR